MNKKTHKTEHLLSLIAAGPSDDIKNPTLNIAYQDKPITSTSNLPLPQKKAEEKIDLIEEIISENIDEVFMRFGACSCINCKNHVHKATKKEFPECVINPKQLSDAEIYEQRTAIRTKVLANMIKNVILIKRKPLH